MANVILYFDEEGNEYKDCDPCGVDMSGKRRIIATGKKKPSTPPLTEEREKVLRWVKASERIPQGAGPQIHYRIDGFHKVNGNFHYSIDDELCEGEIVFTVIGGQLHADYQISKEKWSGLEWLEEIDQPTPSPQTEERIKVPEEIREWIDEKCREVYPYVYDDDAHALNIDAKRHAAKKIALAMYQKMDKKLCDNAYQWILKCNDIQSQLSEAIKERDTYKKILDEYGKV